MSLSERSKDLTTHPVPSFFPLPDLTQIDEPDLPTDYDHDLFSSPDNHPVFPLLYLVPMLVIDHLRFDILLVVFRIICRFPGGEINGGDPKGVLPPGLGAVR